MPEPAADPLASRSPALVGATMPLARALCRRYFRLEVEGLEHVPAGPALVVGNHSNGIVDPTVLCVLSTLWDARGQAAPIYGLAHDFAMRHVSLFGAAIARFGALPAARDHARRALDAGALVLVFPGGDLEAYRHFWRRDEVILGPRSGFVTLARDADVPIVPVVAQGAHRSAVVLHEGRAIAQRIGLKRWARLERFPVALALPWGVAPGPWLPWLPLPFSIRLRFLPPRRVGPDEAPEAVRESVRAAMQSALDVMARRRP